ncbi:D-amino-acid oxidase-like [Branchiostoma floridae]|uniref:D-amino-acid oxidase n=1 Tax=Branchiostoma floridae TaxID=7739 RepID=C3Y3B8_BRAFL|nr:D-amino-acid oxidase-like [Branchiostoma floridae]XP_035682562.1 D-amino-acid oxidase-like [Branchiostoma floridae]|eukprot:XP_002609175.1 hypothetical protein BRAFLDRAFT_115405 [Branchiostoma floridae]
MMKVVVVGGGVIGLSSALCVKERCQRADVTVVAAEFTPNTTGDGAAGIWQPQLWNVTQQELKWLQWTFDHLSRLYKTEFSHRIGLFCQSGYNVFDKEVPDPPWKDIVLGFRHLTEDEVKKFPGYSYGWFNTTLMLECRSYLPWLTQRLKEKGVKFEQRKIASLSEVCSDYDVVINCCGLSARKMLNDQEVKPGRGQIVRVHAPWVKHFLLTHNLDTATYNSPYIIPGINAVALGGLNQVGDWDEGWREEDEKKIWDGAIKMIPAIKGAQVLAKWTGLRPVRERIRLERDTVKDTPVIHNYGHGGYGVTYHWGCALQAASLAAKAMDDIAAKASSTRVHKSRY